MNLGSVLIRPQRLARSVAAARGVDSDAAIVEDLLTLAARLALDPQRADPLLREIGDAVEACAGRFETRMVGRFETASEHLRDWLHPMQSLVAGLQPPSGGLTDESALAEIRQLLERLAGSIGGLTVNRIHQFLEPLFSVVENDLGITPDLLEQEVWLFLDSTVAGLERRPATASTEELRDRRDLASVLRRLKRRFHGSFRFPALDVDRLARELLAVLRRTRMDEAVRRVACSLERLGQGAGALETLNAAVSSEVFGARDLGAAAGEPGDHAGDFGWYASWLLQGKLDDIPLFGPTDLENASSLVGVLTQGSTDHSARIFDGFTDEQKALLRAHSGNEAADPVVLALLDRLNALVRGPALDSETGFSRITLTTATREVAEDFRDDQKLMRLNRMVLEDAYPNLLDRLSRNNIWEDIFGIWTGGWWTNVGRGLLGLLGWPGEEVRVDAEAQRILLGGKILHTAPNPEWHQAPIFSPGSPLRGSQYYNFALAGPEVMEWTAFISALVRDAGASVWHMLQMQPGHRAVGILNGIYDTAHGLNSGIAGNSFSGYRATPFYRWYDFFLELIEARGGLPFLTLTAASFEGKHETALGRNIAAFWFTVWMGDIVNYIGPLSTLNAARDAVLSGMTLLNHNNDWGGGPSTLTPNPAQNHREQDGIVGLVETLYAMWLVSYVEREEYTHPFFPANVPERVWLLWLLGGAGMGLFAGLTGCFVAQVLAWAEDWKRLGLTMLKGMPKMWLLFWPLLYSMREGDTDDGRFNPALGAAFSGYPAKPSPYLLPYAPGQPINVGQGNAGFWSHNPPANGGATLQTYAFDFALDTGAEILASRPGTIVDYFEWAPDDQNTTTNRPAAVTGPGTTGQAWNFVTIRHDLQEDAGGALVPLNPDTGGNAQPLPGHDRDAGGTPRFTYGVYGHGRNGSVSPLFGAAGTLNTNNVIGQQVRQGQPIMLAGDTGVSWYNHLHMHVLPEMAGGGGPNNGYAVPFVFDDVDGNGVCEALKWYESTNTRRP